MSKRKLKSLLQTSQQGKILREGLSTVIVGRPNVGKSSLLNSLVQENKAIVTDIPGTTRDVIEEYVNVRGVPLRLLIQLEFVKQRILLKELVLKDHAKF